MNIDGNLLDVEASFCYLGDMLDAGGGYNTAITHWCCLAWGRFRKLLPILTSHHLSPKVQGRVYEACVRTPMLHSSETWRPNIPDLLCLQHIDRAMIHWICAVNERSIVSSIHLLQKLGLHDITTVLYSRRLRWFGHTQRATTSGIANVTNLTVPGSRGRHGRHRKTWAECVQGDLKELSLTTVDLQDRTMWRRAVCVSLVQPTP